MIYDTETTRSRSYIAKYESLVFLKKIVRPLDFNNFLPNENLVRKAIVLAQQVYYYIKALYKHDFLKTAT